MKRPVCHECERERVAKWEAAREVNGLTEAEWPRPVAPEFPDTKTLALHRKRVH